MCVTMSSYIIFRIILGYIIQIIHIQYIKRQTNFHEFIYLQKRERERERERKLYY